MNSRSAKTFAKYLGLASLVLLAACGALQDKKAGIVKGKGSGSANEGSKTDSTNLPEYVPGDPLLFAEAQKVLQANCVSCHKIGGSAGQAPLDFTSESDFVTGRMVIPGNPSSSPLIARSKFSGEGGGANMPPGDSSYTPRDHEILVEWIKSMNKTSTPGAVFKAFSCNNTDAIAETHGTRLSSQQYRNVLTDIFGPTIYSQLSSDLRNLPEDSDDLGLASLSTLSNLHFEAYTSAALTIATNITSNNETLTRHFGACASQANAASTFLSDLTPTASSNGWGPYERDRSNGENGAADGRTLALNGTTYAKGLGVHAPSSLTYNLGGQYRRFQSAIGIDDEVPGGNGAVIFRVVADGVEIFRSSTLTGASATQLVDLDLTGKNTLQLIVDTDGPDALDHADWADAKLLQAATEVTCLDTYFQGTARSLFRRNLTNEERQAGRNLVLGSTSFITGLNRLLAGHLVHPSFLTRLEVGDGTGNESRFTLSQFEIATRLAFSATNSGPDTLLLDAAARNELASPSQIKEQTLRLMQTARGKTQVRQMFRHWLEQNKGIDVSQLPSEIYQGLNPQGLISSAFVEQDRFIDYIVWDKKLGFEDLMTSRVSFAESQDLANIYEHAQATTNQSQTMGGSRQGILLRVPFLASPKPRTSLVSRGVRIRRDVLCENLPAPSGEAFAQRDKLEPTQAAREMMSTGEYISKLTDSPSCLSCHSRINPTGIGFEAYDSVGRFRSSELLFSPSQVLLRTTSLLPQSPIPAWNGELIAASNIHDFIGVIAKRPESKACFVKKSFRFFAKRLETDADSCVLDSSYSELLKAGGSIQDAFVSLIANRAVNVRRKE